MKPLCFVLMPFGTKSNPGGKDINFDVVYRDLIAPSILAADLEPLRADQEMGGGIIHKPMFERLILCEYAVADLTTANANVFYELGVRHAVRSWSTVLIFAQGSNRLPFDVAPLRARPYALSEDGQVQNLDAAKAALTRQLMEARQAKKDSPVFELVDGYPDIDHTKTDAFRERVRYSEEIRERLARARKAGPAAVDAVARDLGDIRDAESGSVIDLFLSYRAVKAYPKMIELAEKMSPPLAETALVQEQLALALNRENDGERAERILQRLIEKRGPSSETYGLLGRVYKDRWEAAWRTGDKTMAAALLDQAIEAYRKGFEADWRDAYPGVNAVTLMEIRDPPDPQRLGLVPVVAYAVERRLASNKADYWDHATILELALLGKDQAKAWSALGKALASAREIWELETTARNLRLIREARERRGEPLPWATEIEAALQKKADTIKAEFEKTAKV